ncbi:MAG: PQQ-dependent catabolism-associated CXXCW motif protein [Pseudomonadota bacterium]
MPGEVEGYRMEAYRSAVPETLSGATVVDDDAAYALWKAGHVVFIDVLPRAPKPKNLPEGAIWREKKRLSIPGAIWLPNVGYGAIAAETDTFFRHYLDKAAEGDPDRPVLFFCLAECWMSWNAAKRAMAEYGFTNVFWYPDGTDGWDFAHYPLEQVTRAPALEE